MVIATTCRSRYSSLLDACSTCPSFVVFSFASKAVARAEPVSLTWRPTIGSNLMLLLRRDQIFPSSPASENVPASSPFCKHPASRTSSPAARNRSTICPMWMVFHTKTAFDSRLSPNRRFETRHGWRKTGTGRPDRDEIHLDSAVVAPVGHVGSLDLSGIHWVIVGGESGHGARLMRKDWVM